MAEMTGFEPVKGCYALNDLANRRFQPLSHISQCSFFCSKYARIILACRQTLSSMNASNTSLNAIIVLDTI